MPSGKETIVNKALSGVEVKEIIRQKLEMLMLNEGRLNGYLAYGRLRFTIALKLHFDNPAAPESEIEGSSTVMASELDYAIDSPNAERLRHELPVILDVKQPDGTVSQQSVTYPKSDAPEPVEGAVTIRDTTEFEIAKAAWKK